MKRYIPAFLLGFIALTWQVVLMREFSVHFFGNEITFGLLLAAWLFWTGLGSIIAPKFGYTPNRLQWLYYALLLLFPLCLLVLRFSRFFLNTLPGETLGIFPAALFALLLTFCIGFPLGILFVFNASALQDDVYRVYLYEAIGSAFAGLLIYFILIPNLSNWQIVGIVGCFTSFMLYFYFKIWKQVVLLGLCLAALIGLYVFDFPSQQIFWSPFQLLESTDSPYGKLQMLKTEEQISLYVNCAPVYFFPDLAFAEESIHFALGFRPQAQKVLLLGGAGGTLIQALKYPNTQIDYVELDPEIIRISRKHLPEMEEKLFNHPRINVIAADGRFFIKRADKEYEAIIMCLPDPYTAQINRFYTQEFFNLIKSKLHPQGIFAFRISSSENYISLELQDYLASLYFTLKAVFPFVEIVPGGTNIFLASMHKHTINLDAMTSVLSTLDLNNLYVNPQMLQARLHPSRRDMLANTVQSGKPILNSDLKPISFLYNSLLWSKQFRGREKNLLHFFSSLNTFWLLDLPLIIFVLLLSFVGFRRSLSMFLLTPLVVLGMTTIVLEIVVIFTFQTLHGYLYQSIALLFSTFMLGLAWGAYQGLKWHQFLFHRMLFIQGGFVVLTGFFWLILPYQPPVFIFYLVLLILGFLGGNLFVLSNRLYLEHKTHTGMGYGLDLMGSFLGALVVSALLIPVAGLLMLLKYLFLANSFCLIFLFLGKKNRS